MTRGARRERLLACQDHATNTSSPPRRRDSQADKKFNPQMRLGKPRDRVKITAFAEKRKLVLRRVKLWRPPSGRWQRAAANPKRC